MSCQIICANALAIPLADRSVQCVVTSPPYWGLRDYGVVGQLGLEKTPGEYVANMVAVFREVWRVLRDDGLLWLNIGDSYNGYMANQRGTGLETKLQSARKYIEPGAGLRTATLKPKDMCMIPARVAIALQADGWYLRSDIIWSKPNPMPESVTDRPTKAHEYIFMLSKRERYFFDQEAVREPVIPDPRDALWGKTACTSRHDHSADMEQGMMQKPRKGFVRMSNPLGRNVRTVWEIATQAFSEAHFATFPEKLAKRCILAGSRPGDVVLDPFAGAGTAVLVADKLGRRGIGLDLNLEYCQIAKKRCFCDAPLLAQEGRT